MKHILKLLILLFGFGVLQSQSLIGAWQNDHVSELGEALTSVLIVADGYQVITTYNSQTGAFIHTNGGTWELQGNIMTETVEFDTNNADLVGKTVSFEIDLTDDTFQIVDDSRKFKRIDNGTPGKLSGAWLMSGRMRDGNLESRPTNTPRKTMKILSGTRFQWIAYNTETKQFMGTGGGTYTTIDGKYTEQIEFFSRDVSRVGAALEFNFNLKDGHWHHEGLSSKGDPIYEVWSVRE
ncbi:membrane or secreted protein [Paucihalobacter ruber]|uniref:Membrane or secreted protein n=1 Tax=Paucihalobacter ruber TaxID=2567861 RepID=A0A506PC03_9FLAO|nr:membrane or secreted protein [Paucihalobacter ruber]TPV31416.1 membrane or secreted protein [Paucihalobacter ruber]